MNEISVFDLKKILEQIPQNSLIIDVRRHDEREEGYIKGTIHIPLDELSFKIQELKKDFENQNIYFQCRSGMRSANATTIFLQFGFNHVYNVRGGILDWEKAGFEITKG